MSMFKRITRKAPAECNGTSEEPTAAAPQSADQHTLWRERDKPYLILPAI
jgi:hypothetical protein